MAVCPNCGGMLRFDIKGQTMRCDSCASTFDPYAFEYGGSAEESTEYDVTVFKCPQCGGEIYATDQTAAGFCSYCGSSNVLEGHLTKEKKPELIIPFKKTKEDCKSLFKKFTKRAIFAPSDFRSEGNVDSFRGIYMPYWLYDISQSGHIGVPTSRSHRRGDYIIHDHYMCSGEMDSMYNGVSYDASSSFADDISNEIAPFNVKDITGFSPSFLSGFYADVADVPASVYEETAVELARESSYNYLKKRSPMSGESFEKGKEEVKSMIGTQVNAERSAMFPVWFLTYRHGKRVAYATVNGQSGKVSSDLPISVPKYLLCAGVVAAILFAILQIFFTILPSTLLAVISVVSVIGAILYSSEMKKICIKDNHDEDMGLQSRMEQKRKARLDAQRGATFGNETEAFVLTERDIRNNKRRKKIQQKHAKRGSNALTIIVLCFILIPTIIHIFGGMIMAMVGGFSLVGVILVLLSLIISVILTFTSTRNIKDTESKKGISSIIWADIGLAASLAILIFKPVSDIYYYTAAVVAMAGLLIMLIDLMLSYNLLATRPLPQFELYKGGDDRA